MLAGCGGDPLDRLAEGERGRVKRVFHSGELKLESGASVRLAGVEVPGRGEPGAEQARAALNALTAGREVSLLHGGVRTDGFGRAVAQVRTVEGRRWVQGRLLQAGLARVRTEASDRGLAREMLRLEARARSAGRGTWAQPAWRVRLPGEARAGFVIVEGVVTEAARTREGWRLQIGAEVSRFTAVAPRRAAAEFEAAGTPLDRLQGRLVRVRGTARPVYDGLRLELDHPEQMELLSAER